MKHRSIIISALLLILITTLNAADNKENRLLTLNECVNIALQNNTGILISEEDKKKAYAEYRVALAQRLVFINGAIQTQTYAKSASTYTPGDKKVDLGSDYFYLGMVGTVTASISLYNEKKGQAQRSAKSGMKLSNMQARKAIGDVIFNVKKTYYSYFLARENTELLEKLLKSNEERLKITQILYKNAQKPIYDLSKAKLDLSQAQLDLNKAKNAERISREELFNVMGINDPGIDISLQIYEILPELRYSVDGLNKLGEDYYPDLQIIKIQKEINRIKIAFEYASHYPDVDLNLGVAVENGGFRQDFERNFSPSIWSVTPTFAFVAHIPIFTSGMVSSRVDSAQRDYNKTIYQERETLLKMKTAIESNVATLRELQEQINISKLMKENAEKHLLLAKKTYESGAGTQLDLHDANVSLINAQMTYLKARRDYLETIAKLSSIVGLGEDSLCKK